MAAVRSLSARAGHLLKGSSVDEANGTNYLKVGSDGVYGYLGMVFVLLPKFDLAEELAGLVVDLQLAGREHPLAIPCFQCNGPGKREEMKWKWAH